MKTTILKWICGALVRRWARQAKEAGLQWTPPYDEVAYAKGVAIVRLAQGMRPGTTLRNVQKEGTPRGVHHWITKPTNIPISPRMAPLHKLEAVLFLWGGHPAAPLSLAGLATEPTRYTNAGTLVEA